VRSRGAEEENARRGRAGGIDAVGRRALPGGRGGAISS
jgi:hypothetical protein